MAPNIELLIRRGRREVAVFIGLFFLGFVLMPVAIYLVGENTFGEYGGNGYGAFFGTLSGKIRTGDGVAWFLVTSPYLAYLTLRLTIYAWHKIR